MKQRRRHTLKMCVICVMCTAHRPWLNSSSTEQQPKQQNRTRKKYYIVPSYSHTDGGYTYPAWSLSWCIVFVALSAIMPGMLVLGFEWACMCAWRVCVCALDEANERICWAFFLLLFSSFPSDGGVHQNCTFRIRKHGAGRPKSGHQGTQRYHKTKPYSFRSCIHHTYMYDAKGVGAMELLYLWLAGWIVVDLMMILALSDKKEPFEFGQYESRKAYL